MVSSFKEFLKVLERELKQSGYIIEQYKENGFMVNGSALNISLDSSGLIVGDMRGLDTKPAILAVYNFIFENDPYN